MPLKARKHATAALSFELPATEGGSPPEAFQLFEVGTPYKTKKGTFHFTQDSMEAVLKAAADYGNDLLIDYRHFAHEPQPVDPAAAGRAAGFFQLEQRGRQLWAKVTRWTKAAAAALSEGEYRWHSPVFNYDPETGVVAEVLSVGLTNRPATLNLKPLVASLELDDEDDEAVEASPLTQESPMKLILTALSLAEGATEADAVKAIQKLQGPAVQFCSLAGETELPSAVAKAAAWKAAAEQLPEAQKRIAELEMDRTTGKKTALLEQGSREGKISPAMREFCASMDVDQLQKFLAVAPAVAPPAPPKENAGGNVSTAGLTMEEVTVANAMKMSLEDFAKAKARNGGRPNIKPQDAGGAKPQ